MNKLELLWMNIWINVVARFDVIYIPNFKTFLYFQAISWKSLIGKMGIVQSRDVTSNGGFKYHQLNITKLPFSEKHSYGG